MEEIVSLNGSLVPRSQARVSAFDHGFLYGYGLFETMRAYHGRIFLLERHIKRLTSSAETIGLGSYLAGIDLEKTCLDVLKAKGHQLQVLDDWATIMGSSQAILVDPETGVLKAGADPRRQAYAIGK